jgi:hypothetical protein
VSAPLFPILLNQAADTTLLFRGHIAFLTSKIKKEEGADPGMKNFHHPLTPPGFFQSRSD